MFFGFGSRAPVSHFFDRQLLQAAGEGTLTKNASLMYVQASFQRRRKCYQDLLGKLGEAKCLELLERCGSFA